MTKKVSKIDVKHEKAAPAPMRGEPNAVLGSLRGQIDRLFDDLGAGFWRQQMPGRMQGMFPWINAGVVAPAIEAVERGDDYQITAELPGMKPEDVEVRLADGMLTIRGEKSEEMKEEKEDYLLNERSYGEFQRCLQLPAGIDADAVVANFVNGVLTVTVPKSAEAKEKERTIEVKAA